MLMKVNIPKYFNIASLLVALVIFPTFLIYSFFYNNSSGGIFFYLRAASIASVIPVIYFFIYRYLSKEKPKEANIGLLLANLPFFLIFLELNGGLNSPFTIILTLLIIFGFFISAVYGFSAIGLIILFYIFDIVYNNKYEVLTNSHELLMNLLPIILISVPSFIFGNRYLKSLKKNEQMGQMVENLSSDKSQEEAIFSSIMDGVYAVDSERNLVLFNNAAEEMTGWDEKSALGIKCWTVMKLKNEQDISVCEKDCPMLQVWNTGENVVRDDLCFVNKSKKNVQISGAYSPIKDLHGKITGGICVFRDVTKQKEVERLRNEFVSTASHELRTPITTLEGYISLASNDKVAKVDDKAKEYLDKAHDAVLNMSNLVKNLLSVTKIEEGKLDTVIEKFEINDLIEQTLNELKPLADKKGIKLEFQKSGTAEKGKKSLAPQIRVIADHSMIKEVLVNLIENGIKFTLKGEVTINLKSDKDFAIVSIEDTGMGIPKDSQKHIFEKFYRVDNTATREVGGTGLGLYITRSIVETFGGKIWVDSTYKKGAKFIFTIPKTLD